MQRAIRLVAVAGVVCGGVMVSQSGANASQDGGGGRRVLDAPADGAQSVGSAATLARELESRLGDSRTAGSWVDAQGRPVVAVTDDASAAEVTGAGAQAKVVRYSMRELSAAGETLREAPRVAGTAWSVDPKSNTVVVLADATVSAADWSRLKEVADGIGGAVRMERTTDTFTVRTAGAAPIFTRGSRCSAGFNVTNGKETFLLTAGHCGPVGTTWFGDNRGAIGVGTTVASSFPGGDFSLIRYGGPGDGTTDDDRTSAVNLGDGRAVRINGAAEALVGQQVFRSGSTSGLHSGQVTGLNATVNYPEGQVGGLIQTTVCAEPGDSGGPLFAQSLALGVTSGGSGDCTSGGITFFQPVTTALAALGVGIPRATDSDGTAPGDQNGGPAAPVSSAPAADPATGTGTGAGGATPGGGNPQDTPNGQATPAAPAAPAAPGAQGGANAPAAPGAAGYPGTAADTSAFAAISSGRGIGPGVLVIAISFLGLLATLWIRPAGGGGGHAYRRQWN
ncbi:MULTISPECIES: S1 family peptidase [unclassified Streptomyces]|uniref:S1 family peptidase n=1 Tax=unclassified Streptomyces TaxID=2593676 RepID=UPI00381B5510